MGRLVHVPKIATDTAEDLEARGHEKISQGHADIAAAQRMRSQVKRTAPHFNSRTNVPQDVASARAYRAECPKIPEAYRAGSIWICPVDAWERHMRAKHAAKLERGAGVDAYDVALGRKAVAS